MSDATSVLVLDGMMLALQTPVAGMKGLLINGNYFVPFLDTSSSVSSSLSTSVPVSDSGSQSVQSSSITMFNVGTGSFKILAAQGIIEVRHTGNSVHYSTFPVTVSSPSGAISVMVKGDVTQLDCSTLYMQQIYARAHATL